MMDDLPVLEVNYKQGDVLTRNIEGLQKLSISSSLRKNKKGRCKYVEGFEWERVKKFIQGSRSTLEDLYLEIYGDVDEIWPFLAEFPRLSSISLIGINSYGYWLDPPLDPRERQIILPNLKRIVLKNTEIDPYLLQSAPSLESVVLIQSSGQGFQGGHFKRLVFESPQVYGEGNVLTLAGCEMLEELIVSYIDGLKVDLDTCTRLQKIVINNMSYLYEPKNLSRLERLISNCKCLRELEIGCYFPDEFQLTITNDNLKKFTFSSYGVIGYDVVVKLERCEKLETLFVSCETEPLALSQCRSAGFAIGSSCPSLETVTLEGVWISDNEQLPKLLANSPRLKELHLTPRHEDMEIAIKHLPRMAFSLSPSLERLTLKFQSRLPDAENILRENEIPGLAYKLAEWGHTYGHIVHVSKNI